MVVDRPASADWWYNGYVQLRVDWYSAGYERDVRFNMPWSCKFIYTLNTLPETLAF